MKPALRPVHQRTLDDLNRYQYLTVKQLQKRRYSPSVDDYVRNIFTRLYQAGKVLRTTIPLLVPRGSSPYVYTLSEQSKRAFTRDGCAVVKKTPSELEMLSVMNWPHRLSIVDTMIACDLLAEQLPQKVMLDELLHESFIQQWWPKRATPDCFARFRIFEQEKWHSFPICFEIDRGTEGRVAWQAKLERLISWYAGSYQEQFQTRMFRVAVVLVPNQRRRFHLPQLIAWTEECLTTLNATAFDHAFRFTVCDPATATPMELLGKRTWQVPYRDVPVTLWEEVASL